MKKEVDILIVGAGPVGLYAKSCAEMLGFTGFIIENNNKVGGQVIELYPEKDIYDIPGIKKITGKKFINNLKNQANYNGKNIKLLLETTISQISKLDNNSYDIVLSNNLSINTKTILITTGNGLFDPIKLEINNYDSQINYLNLEYCISNIKKYQNKKVVILGGGDSALDWANYLVEKKITNDVILIHRREKYRAKESSVLALRKNNITELKPYHLSNIITKSNVILSATFDNLLTNKKIEIENAMFLVQYGSRVTLANLQKWPLTFSKFNKIVTEHNNYTKMPNVYAAGNCATYEGKYYNLSTGFGEAITALFAISKILHGEKYHPGYLSSN